MSMENVLESLALKIGRAEVQQVILEQSLSAANENGKELQEELNKRDQTLQEQTVELEALKEKLAELLPPQEKGLPEKEAPEDQPEESNEEV